jgi:hypothetical protein
MIKIVAAARRRPGMTHAEYLHYIESVHGSIARANTLGLTRYVQNHVLDGAYGKAAYARWFHRDSITELYFADYRRLVETFTHPYTREVVGPDGANFADLPTNLSLPPAAEQALLAPPPPGSAVKVMHFLKDSGGVLPFTERWQLAHENAMRAVPDLEPRLRGHILSIPTPPPGAAAVGATEHFGGREMPSFDGVSSLWFTAEHDLEAFRRYETALVQQGLLDSELSFFVHVRDVVIFDLTV